MKCNNVLDSIGKTPHIRLSNMFPEHSVWIKDERRNPGGTIKDRIALSMIEDAEKSGMLKPGGIIVEPTSGNTGIGLAMAGAVKGYRVILVMPDSMSIERRFHLKAFGAEIVLTPRESGMKGAVEKATELLKELQGSWMPMQFRNPSNPRIHAERTAMEIIADFPEGFDYLITGVGTGGHITGVGKELKKRFPSINVFAVEPVDSPVLSGGAPGPHPIQGIGAGFIPEICDVKIFDRIIKIKGEEAFAMVRKSAMTEGLLVGISTGASLAAVSSVLKDLPPGQKVITFAYDSGERYQSIEKLWEKQ